MRKKVRRMPLKVYHPLLDALRRYRFNTDVLITERWTGLGPPSWYRAVVELGLMVPVHAVTPRVSGWYKLTDLGARILAAWVLAGYQYPDYCPPRPVQNEAGEWLTCPDELLENARGI